MTRRILAIFMSVAMVLGLLPGSAITAYADSLPSISVNVTNKIDVALAVGPTDVDYSEFADDLRESLLRQGNVSSEDICISELEASEVGTSSNFNWWTYDHSKSNSNLNDIDHDYIELTASNNNNGHAYYDLDRHIVVENGGADLGFRGYGSSAYKDFMYIENTDPTKKTFEFDIEEREAHDALDGVGFFFNTSVTGSYESNNQVMSGYLLFLQYNTSGRGQELALYKFSNVNTKNFHHGNSSTISNLSGFTKLATASYSSTDSFRKLKIEVAPKKVRVWYKGSTAEIADSLVDNDIVTWNVGLNNQTEVIIESTGAYGFGPMGSYRSHSCTRLTTVDLKNLTMKTEEPKTLTEVIRQPEWQNDSKKYIVNLNNQHIDDFDDPQITSEIINRLNNDDVYYIGWGSDVNEDQTNEFLVLNDLKGDFINNNDVESSNYQQQIDKIAASVIQRYTEEITGDTAYVLTTDNVRMTVVGAEVTDSADENWPYGKWKVIHTTEGFSDVEGVYLNNNQYMNNLDVTFEIPGNYEIYYEDSLIKTIVSHRRPIALFDTIAVSGSAITMNGDVVSGSAITVSGSAIAVSGSAIAVSGAAITYVDRSYDPDDPNGIDHTKTVWRYINMSDSSPQWQESDTPIQYINSEDQYLVSLIITDKFGATSIPYTKQITYTEDGVKLAPYADFTVSTSKLYKGSDNSIVTIIDKSYDLYNEPITRIFRITKDGQPYTKELNVGDNDFSQEDEGVYKISLIVTSDNGTSQIITRTITIISDSIPPTVSSNVPNGTETGLSRVVLTFEDLGGSGLKEQQVVITGSNVTPSDIAVGWTEISNSQSRTLFLTNDGENYIHYRISDNAGNVTTGFLGPIIYEANNPYITGILNPMNGSQSQSVKSNLVFQVSEKVIKGDGYITIYNKSNHKKYMDIHSSNNRVKISDTGLVTIELPKALEYNTEYYVTVGANFVKDESGKALAQYGDVNDWSFKTMGSSGIISDDDIKVVKVEASQNNAEGEFAPIINIDKNHSNNYLVYVKAGEFTITPHLSYLSENLSVTSNDCNASLSEDKKSIVIDFADGALNPTVSLHIGNNNTYVFKIVQTDKQVAANVEIDTTSVSASVGNSDLLNAVDIAEDMNASTVERIHVKLLIREPQIQQEKDDLETYITTNTTSNQTIFFDAALLKTVTYDDTTTNESNISNTQEPINIIIDIPDEYQSNYTYQLFRNHNGIIENLIVTVINNGTQLSFETDRFSTYAITYTKMPTSVTQDNVVEVVEELDETEIKPIEVPETLIVEAGNVSNIEITNLPVDAIASYHVNTPTLLSVDESGEVFAKKAGNGEIYVRVETKEETLVYMITIDIKKSKEKSTTVGFIKYYDDIVKYKNINYRITKEALDGKTGTVAVANNQVNTKLPQEVIIPTRIKIDGHTYYVTSIDESAFYNVKTIKKVTIPYTVEDISSTAFTGCKKLKTFTVNQNNPYYSAKKGMLLDKTGEKLLAYPSASGKVTIDSNIKVIGAYAFSVCRGLTEVIIPSTVKTIEGCAFAHSKALVSIKFKGVNVPEIPYPCIFDAINKKAVIIVPNSSMNEYQLVFENAHQPKGVKIKN